MALAAERYSFSFETRGSARAVNSSSLQVVVDGGHWFVDVARHLLKPVGRVFHIPYSVYMALCWAVADWRSATAAVLDRKVAEVGFEVEFMHELLRQLLTDELLSDGKLDTWSQVAVSIRAAARLLPPASAARLVPTAATLRELQVEGVGGVAAIGGPAVDLASGAWFEAATIRMGVDAEHGSTVLSILEMLLGPDGHPGRFHVDNRNDPSSMCSGMLGEIMRTADGIANLNNTLQARSAPVQAARIIVAMRSTMPPPPMCVLPEATQSGGFEYLSMVSYKGAELFAAQFSVGWRACNICARLHIYCRLAGSGETWFRR